MSSWYCILVDRLESSIAITFYLFLFCVDVFISNCDLTEDERKMRLPSNVTTFAVILAKGSY